jgi:hypothetical protein
VSGSTVTDFVPLVAAPFAVALAVAVEVVVAAVASEEPPALEASVPEPDALPEELASVPLLDELPAEAISVVPLDELPAEAVSVPAPGGLEVVSEVDDPLAVEPPAAVTEPPSTTSSSSPPDPSLPTKVGISMSVGLRPAAARAINVDGGIGGGAAEAVVGAGARRAGANFVRTRFALIRYVKRHHFSPGDS